MRHVLTTGMAALFLSACGTVHAPPPKEAFPAPTDYAERANEDTPTFATTNASEEAEGPVPLAQVTVARTAHHGAAHQDRSRIAQAAAGPSPNAVGRGSDHQEMLDIEATLNIVVEHVARAAEELRRLVRGAGGVLVEDVVNQADFATGRFVIRVAAPGTDALMNGLERLGQVRSRQVNARDIGKQYHDAELQLENLKVAMERYEQILAKADKVSDMLAIEHEVTRLRGEIEQVKGTLRWMQDRVARSTITVNLVSPRPNQTIGPAVPEAKLYPSLRGVFLEDLRGNDVQRGYLGGGLSLRVNRAFSLDVDGVRRTSTGSPVKGIDALIITIGGEAYSEFLGNGGRRFLNPFLGWRMGYARFDAKSELAIGATVGVELVKTRYVGVDAAVRGIGLLGSSAHLAVQPELTVTLAF